MPTISMFYGILVTLLYEDNKRHHLPHFHVRYQSMGNSGGNSGDRIQNYENAGQTYFVPGLTLPCRFAIVWAEVDNANNQHVLWNTYQDVFQRYRTASPASYSCRVSG
jgi:hypothetical protein